VAGVLEALKRKERLKAEVRGLLSEREAAEAKRDHHALRPPRPCGLTVHTSIGCAYQCRYCYIYDMGFTSRVEPYPLTGLQLVYALLENKYFIPGIGGTYLAFGSVTEPFHPAVKNRTFEYIEAVYKYLENPVQFSTKAYITKGDAEKLARVSAGRVSPLITIVSIEKSRELEPHAPSPERRLEAMRNLKEAGLKPFLFLRPMIPGVVEAEYTRILDLAAEYGAVGVVAGALRVTKRILEELREAGVDIKEVVRRLKVPLEKMKPGVQYDVEMSDIKKKVAEYARRRGLVFFPSACMANLYTHGLVCWKMVKMGFEARNLKKPEEGEVAEILKAFGATTESVEFTGGELVVGVACKKCDVKLLSEVLRVEYKACARVFRSTR
jgi:DNA repair photolyase